MNVRSGFGLAVSVCALAMSGVHGMAQASQSIKAAPVQAFPFVEEQRSEAAAGLAQKEAALRAAAAEQPESAGLLYALALVLRQEGKAGESLATYTRAAERRKPTAQELRSVALNYVLLNDYDDAIRWLETAAAMAPEDADIEYALGRCYYTKNRFAEAGAAFERVLAARPRDMKAEENLGLAYEATNRTEEAEKALRQATAWSEPKSGDAWPFVDLGVFLLDHNRAAEALEPLQTAVRMQPGLALAQERLGHALAATHQTEAGIQHLQTAAELDPRNPKVHYELGRALRDAGRAEEARKEFALSQQLYASHSAE